MALLPGRDAALPERCRRPALASSHRPGRRWSGEGAVEIPARPLSAWLSHGRHLACGNRSSACHQLPIPMAIASGGYGVRRRVPAAPAGCRLCDRKGDRRLGAREWARCAGEEGLEYWLCRSGLSSGPHGFQRQFPRPHAHQFRRPPTPLPSNAGRNDGIGTPSKRLGRKYAIPPTRSAGSSHGVMTRNAVERPA